MKTLLKSAQEIENMRTSGRILSEVLKIVVSSTKAGITPVYLDQVAKKETLKRNAKPAFLGYQGFPASLCVSVNDQIVHATPSDKPLTEEDVVSFDFGVNYHGMITDSALTIGIGKIDKQAQNLINGTKKALFAAIDLIHDGIRVGDIGSKIEEVLTSSNLSIVKGLTGHGVGHNLHEDPAIPNFGVKGTGEVLKAGTTVAIEPIASISSEKFKLSSDGWTCKTVDGSLAAHFEHTILITKKGCEILT